MSAIPPVRWLSKYIDAWRSTGEFEGLQFR
jgi:hypothetical protein